MAFGGEDDLVFDTPFERQCTTHRVSLLAAGAGSFTVIRGTRDPLKEAHVGSAPREWDDPTTAMYAPPSPPPSLPSLPTLRGPVPPETRRLAQRASPLGAVAVKAALERRASLSGTLTPEMAARTPPPGGSPGSVSALVLDTHRRASVTDAAQTLPGGVAGLAGNRRGSVSGVITEVVTTVENGHVHVRPEAAYGGEVPHGPTPLLVPLPFPPRRRRGTLSRYSPPAPRCVLGAERPARARPRDCRVRGCERVDP